MAKHHLKIYLWVLSFLRPYVLLAIAYLLLELLIQALNMSVPKLIQHLIDVTLPDRNVQNLYVVLGILVLIVILNIGFRAVNALIQRLLSEKTLRDIQLFLFGQLRKLGFSYFERQTTGKTLSMFTTEVNAITSIYQRYLPSAIRQTFMVVLALIMVFNIHFTLSLIIVPSLLLYYLFGAYFAKKAAMTARIVRDDRNEVHATAYNMLSGMQEIVANNKQRWSFDEFMKRNLKFRESTVKEMLWLQGRGTVRKSLIHFGLFAVFVLGIGLVQRGTITVGEFVAFVLYYEIAIGRVTTLITNLTEQRVLMYQLEGIHGMAVQSPEVEEPAEPIVIPSVKGELSFRQVQFHYRDNSPVLRGIDINIRAGERIAIVGTSGNGKSTLLKLVARFYDPVDGTILLDGHPLPSLSFAQIRGSIGYVFQETYLFGSSVMENIRFGHPEATDEEVMQATKAAYAHEFISMLPQGYDTLVGERGLKLSGGQKQRISIARMFVKDPKIILLDEATSALDNISELEVQKAMESLMMGRTTIAVAHRLTTIKDYDAILVLDQGVIAEAGTYSELIARKGLFYQLAEGGRGKHEQMEMDRQLLVEN